MPTHVHLTGVLQYKPEKCWNGYTLIPSIIGSSTAQGAVLYDMNGRIVNKWEGVFGCYDNKLVPGGDIYGTTMHTPGYWLDCTNIVRKDRNNITQWEFRNGEILPDLDTGEPIQSARQHHDYQLEGSPCGYYIPGITPRKDGKMLVNSTVNRNLPEFSPHPVGDTKIMVIDQEGNCLWSWSLFDHWDQLGVETIGRAVHYHCAPVFGRADYVKVTYCNNVNWIGPNRWYDAGDERFHPDNIISDIRILNTSFIIDHRTGDIVWRMGPDFEADKKLQDIGQIVGQHHVHMIPRGLPGEGNILLYDNGGQAGLGRPTPCAPTGYYNATRGHSRVLEIDPVTLEIVWQMTPKEAGYLMPLDANRFYSPFISGMQRLPNGNTMITEGSHGRIFEVTPEHELVWEYVCPYWGTALPMNMVYRSYRLPYEWVPQLEKPAESPIERLDVSTFRVPGAAAPGVKSAVKIKEAKGYFGLSAMCVAADIEE